MASGEHALTVCVKYWPGHAAARVARARMRNSYGSTFGWKTEQLGPEMGDYVLVETTETDKRRRPKTPGSINGGFYPKKEDWPAQYPSVVVAVDDIKASVERSLASPWKFRATDATARDAEREGKIAEGREPRLLSGDVS